MKTGVHKFTGFRNFYALSVWGFVKARTFCGCNTRTCFLLDNTNIPGFDFTSFHYNYRIRFHRFSLDLQVSISKVFIETSGFENMFSSASNFKVTGFCGIKT